MNDETCRSLVYPKLPGINLCVFRLFGPGLCNLLYSWAHAIAFAQEHDLKVIWPTWPQFKIGPWLRGESDKRTYIGLFRPTDWYVTGIKKWSALAYLPRVTPEQYINGHSDRQVVIEIKPKYTFEGLHKHRDLIRQKLIEMTLPRHLKYLDHLPHKYIAVHVRLGDFAPPDPNKNMPNTRTPLAWFRSQIEKAIARYPNMVILIFSDGKPSELSEVLVNKNVQIAKNACSISHLLALANAELLIGSQSTFSYWGEFLSCKSDGLKEMVGEVCVRDE